MSKLWVIGVGGASGSGKSSLAAALARRFGLAVVRLDDFMLDRAHMPPSATGAPNQEVPASLDLAAWHRAALELGSSLLESGRPVRLPVYSRREGRRTGERVLQLDGRLLGQCGVVIEGHLLYLQNVTPRPLLERMDLRIWLSCPPEVQWQRLRERQPTLNRGYYEQVIRPESYRRQGRQRRWADVSYDSAQRAPYQLAECAMWVAQSIQRGVRVRPR